MGFFKQSRNKSCDNVCQYKYEPTFHLLRALEEGMGRGFVHILPSGLSLPSAPIHLYAKVERFKDGIFMSPSQRSEASSPRRSCPQSGHSRFLPGAPCPTVHPPAQSTLGLPVTCPLPLQDSQFPSAVVGGEGSGRNTDHC